jgi:hypothetical protein
LTHDVVDVLQEHERRQRRQAMLADRQARLDREAAEAEAKKAAEDEAPDTVTVYRRMGDRVLQEIFDFEGRERITFVRKDRDAPVEAMTRQNFSDIDDKASIRKAFEVYARKGGRLRERDFFEESLGKPVMKNARPAAKGGTP